MYKAFSDRKNIEKMVRIISVFEEVLALEAMQLPWKENLYKTHADYVKYVSMPSSDDKFKVFIYWDAKVEKEVIFAGILKKLLSDKNFYSELKKFFHRSYGDYKKISDKIYKFGPEYYKKQSNKNLIFCFEEFRDCLKRVLFSYYIPYNLAVICADLVLKEMKSVANAVGDLNPDNTFKILSATGIHSLVKEENVAFYKALAKIQKIYRKNKNREDKKIQKIIFAHWYKFGALMYTHGTNVSYAVSDYEKKFFKFIKADASKELRKIKNQENADKKTVNKALISYKKFPEIKKHIFWLREMLGYRNCESEYSYVYFRHSFALLTEIGRRIGSDEYCAWYLSPQEIIGGLSGKIKVENMIKERVKRGFVIKQEKGRIKVFTGVIKDDLYEDAIGEREQNILKGMPAFVGKVKGKVKIVTDIETEAGKFLDGEILVAPMTTPDYVTLMKKAAAIITDEGGIICHAAIVSRELKIPCVVGTKIATKILKDGDLVEVDADSGVVRILENKKCFLPQKITFAFRHYMPLFYASIIEYCPDDYLILTKNRETACYYLGDLIKSRELGKTLNLDEKIDDLISQCKINNRVLSEFNPVISRIPTQEELISLFRQIIELFLERDKTYTLTTETYWKDIKNVDLNKIKILAESRLESNKINQKNWNLLMKVIIPKLAKNNNLNVKDLLNYTYGEIINLGEGVKVEAKIIKERKKAWCVVSRNNTKELLSITETKDVMRATKPNNDLREVAGVVAMKGKLTGRVILINESAGHRSLDRFFLHGNSSKKIVVASMTQPNILKYLGKIGAIVTDEGGLLCHAAVIAREFKIPCILNTKIATQVFKNGDLVEVDADNGIVKIIKKNK